VNITLVLLRYFPYGGLQRDMLQTAERCREAGHRVRILTGHWQGPRPEGIEVNGCRSGAGPITAGRAASPAGCRRA